MKFENHTKFPLKRCLIASVVIILCYMMVLVLLYSIIYANKIPEYSYIIIICWASLTVLSLASYWIYQLIKYKKTRHDEG